MDAAAKSGQQETRGRAGGVRRAQGRPRDGADLSEKTVTGFLRDIPIDDAAERAQSELELDSQDGPLYPVGAAG